MEKIDELEVIITDFNVSIACVTETWFKQYIDDDRIVIGGFNCERKDRLNKRAGGVVCYLRNSMVYTRMVELEDQTLEVLWLKIMPKRLPRQFYCIVLACIYHPPGANSDIMRNHIINGIDCMTRKHPDCGVMLIGDFNQLKDNFIKTHYRYVQVVKDPTRGQSLSDKIWTNMSPVYEVPVILSELGSSDHNMVFFKPTLYHSLDKGSKVRVAIRCFNSDNKAIFSAMLHAVKWDLMSRLRTCDEQYVFYETVINYLMDQCFPYKTVTRHSADKPWVTDAFRALVKKRQRAHMRGDYLQERWYRNKVNRAAVKHQKEFYQSKIVALTESSTRDWWRHMKSLMGRTSNSATEMQGLANAMCDGSIELLANRLNEFLVSVSNNLPRLTNDHPTFTVYGEIPADYIINVPVTEMALQRIKVNKSTGPDNIPAWLLRDNATVLARPLTALFNSSLREGVIPAMWKTANVIPLPKKRPPRLIENDIRPISLTPIISKTFESIIMTLVDTVLEDKINDNQYGGTSGTCTTDALVEMLHQWYEATDACNTYVRIIALDFFESV